MASNRKAILLQDVDHLGARGDVVSVAPGYLRNYLVPRRLAEEATDARITRDQAPRLGSLGPAGPHVRARAGDLAHADHDDPHDPRARRRGRPPVRLGHGRGHRGRDLADAQDPRRSAQGEARRSDQAARHLPGRHRGVPRGASPRSRRWSYRPRARTSTCPSATTSSDGRARAVAISAIDETGDPGRLPPQDLEAEEAVLGAMLISEVALGECLEHLQPEDFYRTSARRDLPRDPRARAGRAEDRPADRLGPAADAGHARRGRRQDEGLRRSPSRRRWSRTPGATPRSCAPTRRCAA